MDTETLQIMANTSVFKYALELQKALYTFSYKLTPVNLAEYTATTTFDSDFADGRQAFGVYYRVVIKFEEARRHASLRTIFSSICRICTLYLYPISNNISHLVRETEISPSSCTLCLSAGVRSHFMKHTNSSVTRSMEMDAPQTSTSRDLNLRESTPRVLCVVR